MLDFIYIYIVWMHRNFCSRCVKGSGSCVRICWDEFGVVEDSNFRIKKKNLEIQFVFVGNRQLYRYSYCIFLCILLKIIRLERSFFLSYHNTDDIEAFYQKIQLTKILQNFSKQKLIDQQLMVGSITHIYILSVTFVLYYSPPVKSQDKGAYMKHIKSL